MFQKANPLLSAGWHNISACICGVQAWLHGNGVLDEGGPEGMARVIRMAVLKMFDMRDVIAFEKDTPHYRSEGKHGGVSQQEASEFIEIIVPGKPSVTGSDALAPGAPV
jgi:hypothetical protein